jgi:Bacterial SH3 domain
MLLRLVTAISSVAAATAAVAEPVQLTSEDIRSTLTGALIDMDTPAGTVIPVRFGKDGLVSGQAGVLASMLGAARDRGRWWAANDQLCMKWFRWFEAETRCVVLRQDGARIYWSGSSGRSGTATIAEAAPVVAAAAKQPEPPKQPATEIAPAGPAPRVETPKIELAKVEPVKIELPKQPEFATAGSDAPIIRFASAALGAMSLSPPLAGKPSHLLDDPGRSAIAADPVRTSAEQEPLLSKAPPPAKQAAAAMPAVNPPPKAREAKTGYASSTVILASFRVAGVDEDDVLNVRSGPSERYASVGGLPAEGRGVQIVGPCRDEWCPIRHGQITGWVNRTYLAEETSSPAADLAR